VTQAILYAAEHPTREIIVGGAGKFMLLSQRLSPTITDAIVARTAFTAQRTATPKTSGEPNNVFGPARRYNRVEGDFGGMTFQHSLSTWLDRHPGVKAAATVGAALGIGAMLAQRRDGTGPSPVSEDRRFVGSARVHEPSTMTATAR
jgi:hypothetical protein